MAYLKEFLQKAKTKNDKSINPVTIISEFIEIQISNGYTITHNNEPLPNINGIEFHNNSFLI